MLDNIKVEYDTMIPNNVGLSSDKKVLKALERWHPGYINWWKDLGPVGFQESLVYLINSEYHKLSFLNLSNRVPPVTLL